MAPRSPQPIARRPHASPLQPSQRRSQAFSLTELLIGVVISLIVLGAAVQVLVSLIRGDRAAQVELNRKDEVGRVLGLIQEEIRNALRVESSGNLSAQPGLPACSATPLLILRGASAAETITYGLLNQTANATWRGPAVLVRCGPLYNAAGSLNTGSIGDQVVLDALCRTTTPGCDSQSGFSAVSAANNVARNVEITVNSATSGGRIMNMVQVPINTNQVYGLASNTASGTCASGCLDPGGGSIHYRPTLGGSNITGSPSLEDVFYFDGNRSAYTLSRSSGSGDCTSDQCTVRQGTGGNSITIFDGDVLVFKDIQIRL